MRREGRDGGKRDFERDIGEINEGGVSIGVRGLFWQVALTKSSSLLL